MNNRPSIIRYPLFRLTVFMATGIFFFDSFLPDVPISLFTCIAIPLLCILVGSGFLRYKKPVGSYIFGIFTSVCFFLLGGFLVINERNGIEYDWNYDEAIYYGVVKSSPEGKGKSICATVHIDGIIGSIDSSACSVDRDILLYWMKDSTLRDIRCGDVVVFNTKISKAVSDVDLMGFDYRRYLLTKGISGTAFVFPSDMVCHSGNSYSIKNRALQYRDSIVGIYSGWNLKPDNLAVVSALTIGDKSDLTPEVRAMYSAAGTSHVLALSGLHIGILSAILYILLFPLKRIRYGAVLQSLIVALVLWAFAFISGLSPSVVRAVTMCSLYLLASLLVENGLSGLYSLTFTAFMMMVYQPLYLFDISFQLSFIAVFSIIMFFPVFNSMVKSGNKVVRYLWGMVSVSLAAQLGTMPLILYYFGSFPVYFLIANLIVSPLAVCILSLAFASLVLYGIPLIGGLCVSALDFCTSFLNGSMDIICHLDGAQITSAYVNEVQMVLLFALICFMYVWIKRKRPKYIISMLVVLCSITVVEYAKMLDEEQPSLYLAWSDVYVKEGKSRVKLVSDHGIHSVNNINIGVMKTDYWKNKELKPGQKTMELDYAYFCRGFKGDLNSLSRIFKIKKVVVDSSLGEYYHRLIKEQCKKMDIPCIDISGQASYRIVL